VARNRDNNARAIPFHQLPALGGSPVMDGKVIVGAGTDAVKDGERIVG